MRGGRFSRAYAYGYNYIRNKYKFELNTSLSTSYEYFVCDTDIVLIALVKSVVKVHDNIVVFLSRLCEDPPSTVYIN